MEYLKNCPLIKQLGFSGKKFSLHELCSHCYHEYLTCNVHNCPRKLV